MPQSTAEEEHQATDKAIQTKEETTNNPPSYTIEPRLLPKIPPKAPSSDAIIKQQTEIKQAIKAIIEEDQTIIINHIGKSKPNLPNILYDEGLPTIITEIKQSEALTEVAVSEAVEEIMESTLLPTFETSTNSTVEETAPDKKQIIKELSQPEAVEATINDDKLIQPNTTQVSQTISPDHSPDINQLPEKQTLEPKPLLIRIHELLPDTAENKIKKVETLVNNLPELVRINLIEHIASVDQASLETSRVLIVKIAVAADRLNELAKNDNLDSQEATKIEELIQDWYLELLSKLELEVDDQELDNLIELVKSDTYLNNLLEEDSELVDEGTHERKPGAFFPPNIFTLIKSEIHQALGGYAIRSMA